MITISISHGRLVRTQTLGRWTLAGRAVARCRWMAGVPIALAVVLLSPGTAAARQAGDSDARQTLEQTVERGEKTETFIRGLLAELATRNPRAAVEELEGRLADADRGLEAAREALDTPSPDARELGAIVQRATVAAGALQRLRNEVLSLLERTKRDQLEALRTLQQSTDRGFVHLGDPFAEDTREARRLRELLRGAPLLDENTPLPTLEKMIADIETGIERLGARLEADRLAAERDREQAPAADETPTVAAADETSGDQPAAPEVSAEMLPPAALSLAAEALLNGQYERTLSQVEGLSLDAATDARTALTAHLLRAAARFALWVRSGEQDQQLRSGAIADVRECGRLAPDLDLSGVGLSPRFLGFYREHSS